MPNLHDVAQRIVNYCDRACRQKSSAEDPSRSASIGCSMLDVHTRNKKLRRIVGIRAASLTRTYRYVREAFAISAVGGSARRMRGH
jgi:hypothetical protein